jgi:iron complex outermembrane recepter protein
VKRKTLPVAISALFIATQVMAQTQPETPQTIERIEVTGSSIKRVQSEGALPVQIITRAQLERSGINTAEQLLTQITSNGNGFDNLAATSDVVAGANRGNNGLSAANLRSQGSNATLVLLNGRRVAAHGLNGGTVDLKQIPLAAVERVEVLKDGASATYGTDAIGGVINFIMRKDLQGLEANGYFDVTEPGGGSIFRGSLVGGTGDINKDRYNVMGSITYSKNEALLGTQRDFVNTFQPERGLSVDTRGTPYATVFAIAQTRNILSSRATAGGAIVNNRGPLDSPTGTQTFGAINPLDLPGQGGCAQIPGQAPYDEVLWVTPGSKYACAWDTGRAASIQQPVENMNGTLRGVFKVNESMNVFGEFVGSNVVTKKSFSNQQVTSTNTAFRTGGNFPLVYPSTGSSYNEVFNALVAFFPSIEENRGQPIAFRWRCIPCGPRQIETDASTARFLVGADGIFGGWDYKASAWSAYSDTKSTLGGGYYFTDKFGSLITKGILNPFLRAGQEQTQAAVQGLAEASAAGVVLFGGKFGVTAADISASGSLFKLPAGDVMAAVGLDYRQEKYKFNGNASDLVTQGNVFNAPFDSTNDLSEIKRTISAVYTEVAVPITKSFEVTGAFRYDNYTGFGGVTNPKISFRFSPAKEFLVRGSYSEGFRVPTFSQQFFGITISPYSGKDLVDPAKCPKLVVSTTPGCESITPDTIFGGKPNLQPETARSLNLGAIFEPLPWMSAGVDYWEIRRQNQITTLSLSELTKNASLFPESFIRDAAGNLVVIDQRWVNAGETRTKGMDFSLRMNGQMFAGKWSANLDGTYMLSRKSRLLPTSDFSDNEVGKFSAEGDLPVRWKHTLGFTYTQGVWAGTLSNSYVSGYVDRVAPGIENGSVTPALYNPNVKAYTLFNLSGSYTGIKGMTLSAGIKNILNTDPPFSAAYDSDLGAGSSWEPRLADPRGRSFWASLGYKFY